MSGAAVAFQGVEYRYAGSDRAALDGVSLEIPASELAVFLGPSGCGKSTLLRTVNRLVEPQSGRVLLDGDDVAQVDPIGLRRGIGYAIQAVGLFPHLCVAQNIAIVPTLLRWSRAEREQRIDELLALVELDPARYRARFPAQLSGGEQQRVGVARALAARPRVLLMDEPFGAVDAIVRGSLQDETVRIQRTLRTTVLFVTHDVDEALRIADRLVVMRDGNVVQAGKPLEVLTHPANGFVRELLRTEDVIRRLRLVRAEEAMPGGDAPRDAVPIDASASLHEALGLLLAGAPVLSVQREGRAIGKLEFESIRRRLSAA